MPRKLNPELEDRILNAAHKLFLEGGSGALSMRALAKAAHTTTTAIYRRFKDREQILATLVKRVQRDIFARFEPCHSLQEICQRYLEFALSHPHEYQLLNASVFSVTKIERSNLEFVRKRAAEWLGGSPDDHTDLVLALWVSLHGTATLLIAKSVPLRYETKLRSVASQMVDLLLRNERALSKQIGRRTS